jgi:hypothetical protein
VKISKYLEECHAYVKGLSWNLAKQSKENHEKPHARYGASQQRLKLGIHGIQV